ncbi:MAG TPA: 16S rRNA (cytosine(967)-C(5))-methyltransferase RsmB [Gammaproteobacteria bacterium]|nr:16S rRNA (cytosine(967)-C(5))-methyltransferase RsmB [Gammaproteobacteria bacterium]
MKQDVRAAAARVLAQVIASGRSLSDALPPIQSAFADGRDAALLQELVYGTARWYFRLNALLEQLLRKPLKPRDLDVRCLLLAGLYQLDQLALPQRVAVHETVQAVRTLDKEWSRALVNAVLRNFQRDRERLAGVIEGNPVALYAHPAWLIEQLQVDWPESWRDILSANNARPPFSVRVNRLRMTRDEYLELLAERAIEAKPLAWSEQGVRLSSPRPVDALPGFVRGDISVQDGAAQLAAGLLQAAPGQRVLDACAAPGGKTAHILEMAPSAFVTAVDIDAGRLARVGENLARLGLRAKLLAGDAGNPDGWWDSRPFDRILLDVPCSATGVIRRHPDIKLLRRQADIAQLVKRQADILHAVWPLLAPGGMLLYCTCSVLVAENAGQAGRFLGQHGDAVEVPIEAGWGHGCEHGRQVLPGEDEMDGFYFACLHKRS